MDTKEKLELNKSSLELLLSENGDQCINYKAQIVQIEKDLKDLGKIALPSVVFDDIYEAIEEGVSEFDFSDSDNYNVEYGIDYDGRVHHESLELCNHDDLVRMIAEQVSKLFTEKLDTTEADNHQMETLQE